MILLITMISSTDEYILSNINNIDLVKLSEQYINTEEQVEFFFNYINWDIILSKITFSDEFLIRNINRLEWETILEQQYINPEIIDILIQRYGHINKFWDIIAEFQPLTEQFMDMYFDKLPMQNICKLRVLSEKFINENIYRLNMYSVCKYQRLTESFIKNNMDLLYMDLIYTYQELSEKFMSEHINLNYWDLIAKFQYFSFDFMHKHIDELLPFYNNKMRSIATRRLCVKEFISILGMDICLMIESFISIECGCQFIYSSDADTLSIQSIDD